MTQDFRAQQVQLNKIIVSGSSGTATNAKLLIYPISSQDSGNPNQGLINTGLFGVTGIGTDIFMFVSGARNVVGTGGTYGISAFGGDVYVSGSVTAAGGFVGVTSGGGGEVSASYLVYGLTASLPNAKAPVAGTGVSITTAGSASLVFSVNSIPSIIGALSSSFLVFGLTSSLPNAKAIVGGNGISIASAGSASLQITSTVTGVWIEGSPSPRLKTTASVEIGSDNLFAQQRGADAFFYVSGAINGIGQTAYPGVSVFGGDVVVSGNLRVNGAQITTSSMRMSVANYASTTNTISNPAVIGQVIFPANEFSGVFMLRGILASTVNGQTAYVKFWNISSGVYVDIGGAGINTLSGTSLTPTMIESVSLSGAAGFTTTDRQLYELQLFSSTGSNVVYAGGWELS